MQDLEQKQLFGGAITFSIPNRFVDVSDFRQVPGTATTFFHWLIQLDNQEVFTDIDVEQTIIIELLEQVSDVSDVREAAAFHFQEMASLNESTRQEIQVTEALGEMDMPHLK